MSTLTISVNTIKFNVNSAVFETKAVYNRLDSDTARHFMSFVFGNDYIDLNDVEAFILKRFPDLPAMMQNEMAEAIVKTLFAAHNISAWA